MTSTPELAARLTPHDELRCSHGYELRLFVGMRVALAALLLSLPVIAAGDELHFTNHFRAQPSCASWITQAFGVDVNHDGKLDVVGSGPDGYYVLFGNGDGTFQPCVATAAANPGTISAVADLDGDGIDDLIVTLPGPSLAIYAGHPDGTFALTSSIPPSVPGGGVIVADLNGDGRPDLITGRVATSVLINQGGLSFSSTILPYAGNNIALGDFNGDGKPDLIIASNEYYDHSTVYYLPGDGHGGFGKPASSTTLSPEVDAIVDWKHEGHLDFVLNDRIAFGGVVFGTASPVATEFSASGPYIDLDGDGIRDFVLPPALGSGLDYVSFSRGRADGTLESARAVRMPPAGIKAFAAGDFDGDGRTDLVFLYPGALFFARSTGPGEFEALNGFAADALIPKDMNGDGKADLIVALQDRIVVYLNDGSGHFQQDRETAIPFRIQTAVTGFTADFDGDGQTDLVLADQFGDCWVFFGNADRSFATPQELRPRAGGLLVGVGKFLKGNQEQLAFSNSIVAVQRNGVTTTVARVPISILSVDDVDGDGLTDLHGFDPTSNFHDYVYFSNGDGTFAAIEADYSFGYFDVDANGTLDEIGHGDGSVHVTFVPPWCDWIRSVSRQRIYSDRTLLSGLRLISPSITTADFDGDGHVDMFMRNGTIRMYEPDGSFRASEAVDFGSCTPVGVADFNADEKSDFLVVDGRNFYVLFNHPTSYGSNAPQIRFQIADATFGDGSNATITAAGDPLPTGGVTIRDGHTVLGYADLMAGAGKVTLNVPGGVTSLTAEYSGDVNYAPTMVNQSATVTPSPVNLDLDLGGNYAGLPVPVTVTITPRQGAYLGPLTGHVNLILNGTVAASVPAAPTVTFAANMPQPRYWGIAAEYTGDRSQTDSFSSRWTFPILKPAFALDRTTISSVAVDDHRYYIDVTFRDAAGAVMPIGAMSGLDVRATTTAGTISNPDPQPNPRRFHLTLPDTRTAAVVNATLNGVPFATITVTPPALSHHRAASH